MMVGGGADEELVSEEPCPVDEWPPPNLELTNKDGSSRLLFLTVQYVGDGGGNNFNTGLESFSELEERVVSPLDPNMGCTACYSPVYRPGTPLIQAPVSPTGDFLSPSSPSPTSSLQEPGMIVPTSSLQEPGMIVLSEPCQFTTAENYVVTTGGRMFSQDQVTTDDGKLLLLSTEATQPTELVVTGGEDCADQRVELLLSNGTIAYGIMESEDNTGTRVIQIPREYLVSAQPENTNLPQEHGNEQTQQTINIQDQSVQDENGHLREIYNTLKEQGLIIEPGELRLETDLDQGQQMLDTSLLQETTQLQQHISPDYSLPPTQKHYWCEECNELLDADCREHQINRKISDKAVPSRARATLPASYLAIQRITDTTREEYGVFARKSIPKRTQFGPMEGVIIKSEDVQLVYEGPHLELTIETDTGDWRTLDVSNENLSNWMRFVRIATPDKSPNLLISQLGMSLFFTTTQTIHLKQELLAWYSPVYALRRNLPSDPPPPEWPCTTCGEKLKTYDELMEHVNNCHKTTSNCALFGANYKFIFE